MTTARDTLCCPACGAALATIKNGQLVAVGGDPIFDDGDCLDWADGLVALPRPPLYVSWECLRGTCHTCSELLFGLQVDFAVLPFEHMSPAEADDYIGEMRWSSSNWRVEEPHQEEHPWRWLSARIEVGHLVGQHNLIGPFSVAATAISDPEGYGLYRLLRNIITHYWESWLRNAHSAQHAGNRTS